MPVDFEELVEKVRALLRKVQAKIEEFRRKLNSLLSHVPGFLHWAVEKVLDLWQKFLAKMEDVWDIVSTPLTQPGNPWLLHDVGERWNSQLGLPTDRRANDVESDDLLVDDNWDGTAAEAYRSKIDGQKSALQAVGTMAQTVSSAMNSVKTGTYSFWAGVVLAVIGFVTAIVAAAVALAGVVTSPGAVIALILGAVAFVAGVTAGMLLLQSSLNDAKDTLRNARMYADQWPTFAL